MHDFYYFFNFVSVFEILHNGSLAQLLSHYMVLLLVMSRGSRRDSSSSSSCSTFACIVFIWHPLVYFYIGFTHDEQRVSVPGF